MMCSGDMPSAFANVAAVGAFSKIQMAVSTWPEEVEYHGEPNGTLWRLIPGSAVHNLFPTMTAGMQSMTWIAMTLLWIIHMI